MTRKALVGQLKWIIIALSISRERPVICNKSIDAGLKTDDFFSVSLLPADGDSYGSASEAESTPDRATRLPQAVTFEDETFDRE